MAVEEDFSSIYLKCFHKKNKKEKHSHVLLVYFLNYMLRKKPEKKSTKMLRWLTMGGRYIQDCYCHILGGRGGPNSLS